MEMKNCVPNSRQLSIRNMQMIAASTESIYSVTVYQTNAGLWGVKVACEEREMMLAVETTRGGLKMWRNIQNAIFYVQKNCKFARDVFVEIGDWTLVRLNLPRQSS